MVAFALSAVSPLYAQPPPHTAPAPALSEAATTAAKPSPTPDEAARATQAFEAGVQAYHRGDYAAARDAFALSYELDPTYRTAAVLGQTEEKLGHLAQAATLLNWALFHLDASVDPNTRSRIDADLKLVQGRILRLTLKTPIPFHEVLIDDLHFSSNSLRLLPEGEGTWTIYLEPQAHQVTVRADGYPEQKRLVEGRAGTLLDWQLRWHADPQPKTPEPVAAHDVAPLTPINNTQPKAPIAESSSSAPAWQLPTAITTSGLALLAAGFGLYSLHQYGVASDNFDETKQALLKTGLVQPCGPLGPQSARPACNSLAASVDDRVTYGNRAIATLSTAGGLALTSTALWLWWWHARVAEQGTTALTVYPVVAGDTWGGAFRLSY